MDSGTDLTIQSMAVNMLMNNQKQSSNSSGLGGLAQSFLGGSNSNSNNQSGGSGGGLAGQLMGSFLGGNKPQNQQGQQYNSQQGYGTNQQQSSYGQQQQQSYNQSNQAQGSSSSGGGFLGKLFGGSSSVSLP